MLPLCVDHESMHYLFFACPAVNIFRQVIKSICGIQGAVSTWTEILHQLLLIGAIYYPWRYCNYKWLHKDDVQLSYLRSLLSNVRAKMRHLLVTADPDCAIVEFMVSWE